MINAAIVRNDKIVNIIYVSETVLTEWTAQGQELINTEQLGLAIGDYRDGDNWYRDIDGQKMQLPLPAETPPSLYAELTEAQQIIDIMTGEVE